MITKGDSLDGSKATVNVAFPHTASWSAVSGDASNWLWKFVQDSFPGQTLYLFLSGLGPALDNRITRYRLVSKSAPAKLWLENGSKLIGEGLEEYESGLYLWSFITPSANALPSMIDYLRSNRGGFLFLFDTIPKCQGIFTSIVKSRADGLRASIDKTQVVSDLCQHGAIPVRIWGEFDDRELWVEIYTQSPSPSSGRANGLA